MLLSIKCSSQSWIPTAMADMPMATANNAVCKGSTAVGNFMYSFGGIDTSKIYTGIHQKCFKYDITSDVWSSIPDLPDTLGKVAAAASFVKGKIYIIGGYHVYQNGSEKSSTRVHVFNPVTDLYESDGAPVPVPIDDQAQCVWRDSLIYVITGWSNTTNVPDVQIYNPSMNSWSVGTSVPNNNAFRAFGSQGVIRKDTIYYYGGASSSSNFPANGFMRVGIIDSMNPTNITWLPFKNNNGHELYRLIALANPTGSITFLGGSSISYNYNGISYATNTGVPPANEQVVYNTNSASFSSDYSQNFPMDLRGYADISSTIKYISGGMENNQVVSKKTFKLSFLNSLGSSEITREFGIAIYPNPIRDFLNISLEKLSNDIRFELISSTGHEVMSGLIEKKQSQISLENLSNGTYFLVLEIEGEKIVKKLSKN